MKKFALLAMMGLVLGSNVAFAARHSDDPAVGSSRTAQVNRGLAASKYCPFSNDVGRADNKANRMMPQGQQHADASKSSTNTTRR